MIWINLILVAGVLAVLLLNSIVIVPTFHVGLVRRFKKLTGKQLGAGLGFVLPFIEDVLFESAGKEPTTIELKELLLELTVVSKDDQKIVVGGKLFFRMDPNFVSTFVMLGKGVLGGAINAIESDVRAIAGTQVGDSFVEEHQAIQDLINSVLRLRVPPHQEPEKFGVTLDDVKPENRLKFYRDHVKGIKSILKKEKKHPKDISTVERRFGIDVETFELTKVVFSEEIMKAREQQKKDVLEMKAAEERKREKIKIYGELRAKGVPVREAINLVETITGAAERKIISVEGGSSPIAEAAAIIAGGGKK